MSRTTSLDATVSNGWGQSANGEMINQTGLDLFCYVCSCFTLNSLSGTQGFEFSIGTSDGTYSQFDWTKQKRAATSTTQRLGSISGFVRVDNGDRVGAFIENQSSGVDARIFSYGMFVVPIDVATGSILTLPSWYNPLVQGQILNTGSYEQDIFDNNWTEVQSPMVLDSDSYQVSNPFASAILNNSGETRIFMIDVTQSVKNNSLVTSSIFEHKLRKRLSGGTFEDFANEIPQRRSATNDDDRSMHYAQLVSLEDQQGAAPFIRNDSDTNDLDYRGNLIKMRAVG
jgi:hypothetical protein